MVKMITLYRYWLWIIGLAAIFFASSCIAQEATEKSKLNDRPISVTVKIKTYDNRQIEGLALYLATSREVVRTFSDKSGKLIFNVNVTEKEKHVLLMVGTSSIQDKTIPLPPKLKVRENEEQVKLRLGLLKEYYYPYFTPQDRYVTIPLNNKQSDYEVALDLGQAVTASFKIINPVNNESVELLSIRDRGFLSSMRRYSFNANTQVASYYGLPLGKEGELYVLHFPYVITIPFTSEQAKTNLDFGSKFMYINYDEKAYNYIHPHLDDGKPIAKIRIMGNHEMEYFGSDASSPGVYTLLPVEGGPLVIHKGRRAYWPNEHTYPTPRVRYEKYLVVPGLLHDVTLNQASFNRIIAVLDAIRSGIDLSKYDIPMIEVTKDDIIDEVEFDCVEVGKSIDRLIKDTNWSRDSAPWVNTGDHLRQEKDSSDSD